MDCTMAYGPSFRADALMYLNGMRDDARTFEEIYGVSPVDAEMICKEIQNLLSSIQCY